jgi:dihydrodipicolinate synthase/N-acetylneuraminate lyase
LHKNLQNGLVKIRDKTGDFMLRYERCILATCPIPWDNTNSFAEDVFRSQIQHILKKGTKHIYIFGTAGEGYAVSESQFDLITQTFSDEMSVDNAKPMVGLISISLQTVIERIERCCAMGVRSFQLSLPAWGECTFSEIRSFFTETCGRFEDCSFLHYNCPRSKRLITPDEYGLLAKEFPNLIATKNGASSTIDIISLMRKAPQLRHFLTEFGFVTASLLGLHVGLLISIASINWKTAKIFYQACVDGKSQEIGNYATELEEIHDHLFRIIGQQGHVDGVFDKLFSKIADDNFPLRLLPPYGYADDESFHEFVKYVKETYPHWAG